MGAERWKSVNPPNDSFELLSETNPKLQQAILLFMYSAYCFNRATGAAVLYGKYLGTAGKLATKTIKGKDMLVGKYWGVRSSV